MDLARALAVSASGMEAQTTRLRVIAENLANQDTTGGTPGADAYRRKTISFASVIDRSTGTASVRVKRIAADPSDQPMRYDPSNPAANAAGYVKTPNVTGLVEMMDMRAAQGSYKANLNVMQTTRAMLSRTIDLLK